MERKSAEGLNIVRSKEFDGVPRSYYPSLSCPGVMGPLDVEGGKRRVGGAGLTRLEETRCHVIQSATGRLP